MTKFTSPSFMVAMGGGSGAMCREKGHSATDAKGRCLCCGEAVPTVRTFADVFANLTPEQAAFYDVVRSVKPI